MLRDTLADLIWNALQEGAEGLDVQIDLSGEVTPLERIVMQRAAEALAPNLAIDLVLRVSSRTMGQLAEDNKVVKIDWTRVPDIEAIYSAISGADPDDCHHEAKLCRSVVITVLQQYLGATNAG